MTEGAGNCTLKTVVQISGSGVIVVYFVLSWGCLWFDGWYPGKLFFASVCAPLRAVFIPGPGPAGVAYVMSGQYD